LEGPEAVLQRLADELRSRELRLLLARVRAAHLGGGSTTEALRAAAADVSAEIAQQVETEIEGAPLRLVFPMLALLLPPLLALVLYPPASLLIEGLTGAGPGTLPGG
jgi:pilus assembly protein TadC